MGKGSRKVNAIFMVEDIKDETPMEIYMTNIGPDGYGQSESGVCGPRVLSADGIPWSRCSGLGSH